MLTEIDERKGLVKTYWSAVRERVFKVEPQFAKLVDELNPDESLPLYIAYYPYGAMDADTESTLFPDMKGSFYRLSDPNVPKDVLTHLGYSKNNTPLGMVLEKQIECFVDLKKKGVTIPTCIYTPGKFFPLARLLNKENKRIYAPYGLLYSTAGARSVFMLPNIGCITNHEFLQRDFKIKTSAPKIMYNHWQVFKEIVNSKAINSNWRCCVMYFSENWIIKLNSDKKWIKLKDYLQILAWNKCEYQINRIHYDMIFSLIQQNRNLKPNPYLLDTAKHLFAIVCGAVPGYVPAINEDALPVGIIQQIFDTSYGLKKYLPNIFHPEHYNFEIAQYPTYYSLQNPSILVFSPKSRQLTSKLSEMRELQHIINVFLSELAKDNGMCSPNSLMNQIARKIKFTYFHSKFDSHGIIQPSATIASLDPRFNFTVCKDISSSRFACDGPFARGCIRIST